MKQPDKIFGHTYLIHVNLNSTLHTSRLRSLHTSIWHKAEQAHRGLVDGLSAVRAACTILHQPVTAAPAVGVATGKATNGCYAAGIADCT